MEKPGFGGSSTGFGRKYLLPPSASAMCSHSRRCEVPPSSCTVLTSRSRMPDDGLEGGSGREDKKGDRLLRRHCRHA
ncbi:hypothetical protein E2562_007062 [Oryza meyeriana var. granulata]|uniref:Uncharacterized protein n=1 Tax=Oryza meyeriana var. granulata TaxID=110450 RepID=A0A6G1F4V5_9ORYZ|nr:hypothetical protein E2562_007062 [Oryza meyeriana var. granulata]